MWLHTDRLYLALFGSVLFTSALAGVGKKIPACCEYQIKKAYSSVGFSVYKWRVMKQEGIFRNFEGCIRWSGGSLAINKDVSIHLALGCVQR